MFITKKRYEKTIEQVIKEQLDNKVQQEVYKQMKAIMNYVKETRESFIRIEAIKFLQSNIKERKITSIKELLNWLRKYEFTL